MNSQEAISKSKNTVLNILILLLAAFISFKIYSAQLAQINSLKEKKEVELKKNDVLEEMGTIKKRLAAYIKFINQKDTPSIINALGKIAQDSAIEIISLRPDASIEEEQALFQVYPFHLRLRADNYHTVGDFIANLESHKDIYCVRSIDITPDALYGEPSSGNGNDMVMVDLDIFTILAKK